MKKLGVILSVLAATVIVIAVVVFSCNKETGTARHSAKVQKAGLVTSSPIMLPSGKLVVLEIICTETNGTCVIDGNIYTLDDNGNPENSGTYHIENQCNSWVWGCGGVCFPGHLGITLVDLLGLVNDPSFPVNCCSTSTGGPCDYIRPVIQLPSGACVTVEIECCNGEISGWFDVVDCETGNTLWKGDFCATYQGPLDNPNEFNNPNNWVWCGSSDAPSGILETLAHAWLVPCLQ
jgi:hypothetical protein